ncbi:helix-turn-helix domain-containing protein [Nesterenkonia sp. E16_7]|uniref:helix-turn-helix transcriptional regulator n=1 Tax=unclassified Nesterenkonia TaxID=2629769 RepID=UPI001A923808|nr:MULTISPECIES: helix-turn-helix domain-containing protein [unclassified Nesterenkonia]MBO0596471.1 helix-turn-helix domain-containing protein [Nesterenkonia sp. E16_10]MBO0597301.1 helix-turn-helix domain-containing protein [Nesterenkonia sp. E16_7]
MSATKAATDDIRVKAPQDQLLTIEEAAQYLRTTPSTLRYWQGISKGPKSFKLGVRRLYRKSSLDEFIAQAESEQYEVSA